MNPEFHEIKEIKKFIIYVIVLLFFSREIFFKTVYDFYTVYASAK